VIKCIAIFRVSVKSFDGILKIKKILESGTEAAKQKNFDVKITILGAPDYLC
jgi:translation initiation factor 2 alpha subunit (eIF-2alpha)